MYPEGDGEDEKGDEYQYIELPVRWEGMRIHPTSTGLPRDAEENIPEEIKERIMAEESASGEEQRDASTGEPILQEGWEILGSWDSDESWPSDGSSRDQGDDPDWSD